MRRTFELYPELLLIDATHQVYNLKMPLYLMLVVDGNGEGEIVGGFIVVNKEKPMIKRRIQIFKDKNPNWCDTKAILTTTTQTGTLSGVSGLKESNIASSA